MATTLKHRKVNIVTLAPGETLADHCKPGDIALVEAKEGWWPYFIDEDGKADTYDQPFASYKEALWAAKAAAEFASE